MIVFNRLFERNGQPRSQSSASKPHIVVALVLPAVVCLMSLMTSCAADVNDVDLAITPQADEVIGFEAYLNRGTTRAYSENNQLTLTELQSSANTSYGKYGFGVFAYHTGKKHFTQAALPEFMYNQQVTYQDSKWKYSPLKYWPNGYGESDGSKGNIPVYTSFFAYAPYSPCNPFETSFTDGVNMTNMCITECTDNNEPGYPYVRYRISKDPVNNQVDLCYAEPLLDLQKQSTNLAFNFKHALAGLKVTIDSRVNQTAASSPSTGTVEAESRIYVRSITFEGFTTEGTLNLNSTGSKPTWYSYLGSGKLSKSPVVFNDCRCDGLEATTADAGEYTFVKSCLLNPDIIQKDGLTTQPGVDATTRNLFTDTNADFPLFVIPNGDPLMVTISYDVETQDPNLAADMLSDGITPGSSINNTITKTIKVSGDELKLEAGKTYTVALHLGMTNVDFDASVGTEWENMEINTINVSSTINSWGGTVGRDGVANKE